MRAPVALFVLALGAPALAQTPGSLWPDRLPPTRTEPRTDSAPAAFAASLGATAGLLALGAGLWAVLPPGDPTVDLYTPRDVAYAVLATGLIAGPMAGNARLGARDDLGRSMTIKAAGLAPGALLILTGGLFGIGCREAESGCTFPLRLVVAGGALAGAGVAAGTVYDLATIPRNAARAREALDTRRALQVGLAPVRGRPGVFAVVPL